MSPLFFGFISFLGWGIGDIYGTIAARKVGTYSALLWNLIFGVVSISFYIPFVISDLLNLTPSLFFFNIILGLIFIIGFITFNEGLRTANPSLVGTISASFAASTIVLSLLFLRESITRQQIISIIIIFLGLTLASLDFKELKKRKGNTQKGIFLALVTMITWGIYYTFIKIPVRRIGWFWPQYISLSLFPFLFLYMKLRKIKLVKPTFKNALLPLVANGILVAVGEFSYNYGISKGLTSIVVPIAGSYPILFVFLAFIFFKDPISKQQIVGIVTTLVGILLLSLFST